MASLVQAAASPDLSVLGVCKCAVERLNSSWCVKGSGFKHGTSLTPPGECEGALRREISELLDQRCAIDMFFLKHQLRGLMPSHGKKSSRMWCIANLSNSCNFFSRCSTYRRYSFYSGLRILDKACLKQTCCKYRRDASIYTACRLY